VSSTAHRLAPIEGLRACAALGVVWIHCWTFTGNPGLTLGINWARPLAIVGQGVDLFFVISGFCMYLAYARVADALTLRGYGRFLKRRWLRIAPAYYLVVLACFAGRWWLTDELAVRALLSHLTFSNLLLHQPSLASPFWSLDTEAQFYVLLPPILYAMRRWGSRRALTVLIVAGVGVRLADAYGAFGPPAGLEGLIPAHIVEFAWGIAVAVAHTGGTRLPAWLRGARGVLIALALAYAGRVLRSHEIMSLGGVGTTARALADPIMTCGFAGLLWSALHVESPLHRPLSTAPMRRLGRWSYSLYLTHWWIATWVSAQVRARLGDQLWTTAAAFACTLAIVVPVSWLLYSWVEAPYFAWREQRKPAVA